MFLFLQIFMFKLVEGEEELRNKTKALNLSG